MSNNLSISINKKRRRLNSECNNLKIENDILDTINNDLSKELNTLRLENDKLKKKNLILKTSIKNIRSLLDLINI